jgi:hypothetical protein
MALNIGNKIENNGSSANGRLSADEFNQLVAQVNLNTPIEVESEEKLQQMAKDGLIVEGQIYYIPEDED